MIRPIGPAVIRHRDTGEIYEIPSNDLYFEDVSRHERDMGPEVLWSARIDHAELGELEWQVTEYPEGAISGTPEADVNGHELQIDFDFEIDYSAPDVDPDDAADEDDVDPLPTSITNGDADEMREWFLENYEDPANSLPYSSGDGGFQWVNGGPYSPLEALQEEFDRIYSFESIEAVAESITDQDGTFDWSPRDRSESLDERVFRLAERLDRHLPLAERLVPSEETGAFGMVATLAAKPDLLKATLDRIRDALEDCLSSQSNGLSENDHEVRKLRRMLTQYANDPQRIEMDTNSVRKGILAKIRTGDLPGSDAIRDLLFTLQDAEHGIRATDANIATNRRILESAIVNEPSSDDIQAIQEAAPVLEAITEGDLQEQMRDDLEILAKYDRQLGGVTRTDGFGRDEITRVVGRAARMLLAIKKTPEIISKLESSTAIKVGKIISSIGSILLVGGAILKFFLP
ncbi:hypothetical protein [Rhizobium laguerreae]|uniref:hypothetical protein n=1 Tax=Rhizobium laguerreae TaxID=1076926 RepID=UPI001A8D3994|nr:hypothetical protein [Rhizobium laguerreae]MBN9987125.1 hypothetical protein [Rhizobium laguerreae]MBY3538072.1 hypothetical protein [Rhizobium laguerreae]MBY3551440.1 hypothetical protein [Rhizobium laguerreae]